MYITGGLGPAHTNEGFTFAYDLPNETAYAETCASIALVFWAQRMFHLDPDSRYIDVMERALYNGVLSGVSYEGDRFLLRQSARVVPERQSVRALERHHVRPLLPPLGVVRLPVLPAQSGAAGRQHRLVLLFSTSADTLYVHLYNQNTRRASNLSGNTVQLEQKTNYPWDGRHSTQRSRSSSRPPSNWRCASPAGAATSSFAVNGAPIEASMQPRATRICSATWASGDEVTLSLAMPVERIAPHPQHPPGCRTDRVAARPGRLLSGRSR